MYNLETNWTDKQKILQKKKLYDSKSHHGMILKVQKSANSIPKKKKMNFTGDGTDKPGPSEYQLYTNEFGLDTVGGSNFGQSSSVR